ncbi:LysR family transcriptional regulator [Brucella pseudogrignonensis]|nr:LysR family transcriptional regulator [Brucella pseudogrignonensis]
MDMRQMRYFVAIVEHGSFSRAAEFLHVAQPALSLHVRNMEADLETPLLFRTPRGVQPTEAGTILLRHARTILDQLTVAEEEIRGHQNDPEGEVRLGLPGTIGEILGVPLITAVHLRYPRIKLRIAEAMSGFVQQWLREGSIDLAVLYGEVAETGIRTEALLEEPLQFFGAPALAERDGLPPSGTALPFPDATRLPLILPGEGHGLRELLKRHARADDLGLNTVIEVDSYNNIKSLVCEGFGYSILPENAIAAEVAAGRLAHWPIISPALRRTVHLAHPGERPMTNAVRVVQDLARETLRDLARNRRWIGATGLEQFDDGGHTP